MEPSIRIKEGVDFVFNETPELANIGSKEEYSAYLDTIFPDSKVKDIVYHATNTKFNKFDKSFAGTGVGDNLSGKFMFSLDKEDYKEYFKYLITALVNIETESFSNKGNNSGFLDVDEVGVFEPKQIHILGSKQDIEGFKEFVNSRSLNIETEQLQDEDIFPTEEDLLTDKSSYTQEYPLTSKGSNVNKQLNEKLIDWLTVVGLTLKDVSHITNELGEKLDAIAVTKLYNGVIEYVEGKMDETTLPEEAAHVLVAILKKNNKALYNSLVYNVKNRPEYAEVKEEYKGVYRTEEQFINEAIGKVISKVIVGEESMPKSKRIWDRIVNFVRDLFSRLGVTFDSFGSDMNPFLEAAELLQDLDTAREYAETYEGIRKEYKGIEYYQLSDEANNAYVNAQKYLRNQVNENTSDVIKSHTDYTDRITGEKVKSRVSDRTTEYKSTKYKNKGTTDKSYALQGTKTHEYLKVVGEYYVKHGKFPTYNEARNLVYEFLKTHPDFEKYDKNNLIWDLGDKATTKEIGYSEVIAGSKELIDGIYRKGDEIKHLTGSTNNTEIFFELPLYDKFNSEAGTMDLTVLYPDGSIGIYYYETMQFRKFKGKVIENSIDIWKEGLFDIQIEGYKDLLRANLGRDIVFSETRIIPIDVRLNYQNKKIMEGISMGARMNSKDVREHLKQVPVGREKVGINKLDESLEKLYNLRDNLAKIVQKDYNDMVARKRLASIRKVIQNLLVYNNANTLYGEIKSMMSDYQSKLLANTSNDKVIMDDINEYSGYTDLYLDFIDELSRKAYKTKKGTTDETIRASLDKTIGMLGAIKFDLMEFNEQIKAKRNDILNLMDSGSKLSDEYKQMSFISRTFSRLSEIKNPIFKRLSNLVNQTEVNINKKSDKFNQVLTSKIKTLEDYAKSKGLKLQDMYNKIINPKTSHLISRYDGSYYAELEEAKSKKDNKWLLSNTLIKKTSKGFEYTGKAKESFDRALANKKARLKQLYGDEELVEREINAWRKNHDVSYNTEALYNPHNNYVKLIDNKAKYTDAYKEMLSIEPLKDFYEFHKSTLEMISEITGKKISNNYVADIQSDLVELATNNGVFQTLNLRQHLRESLYVKEYDQTLGVTDENGNPTGEIPLIGYGGLFKPLTSVERKQLETQVLADGFEQGSEAYLEEMKKRSSIAERKKASKFKSKDLGRSLQLFANSAFTYEAYKNTESLALGLKAYLQSEGGNRTAVDSQGKPLINKFTKSLRKITGVPEGDVEALDTFIKMYWYGQSKQGMDKLIKKEIKDSKGNVYDKKYLSSVKGAQFMMKYLSFKALGLNYFSGIGNTIGVMSNLYFLRKENIELTKEAYKAARELHKSDRESYHALNEIVKPYAHDVKYEAANKLSAGTLNKVLTMDNMYFMMKKPDEFIDRTVNTTMAYSYGIDANGNVVRLAKDKSAKPIIEFLSKDEKGDYTLALTTEQLADFRIKVQATANKIKGSMPEQDKAQYTSNILLSMMMQYRNWMPGMIRTRFKSLGYTPNMGELDVGRFQVLVGEIFGASSPLESLKSFGNLMNRLIPLYEMRTRGLKKISRSTSLHYLNEFAESNPDEYNKFREEVESRNPNLSVAELKEKMLDEFMELREAKMKALVVEIQFLLLLGLMMVGLSSLGPDDEDGIGDFASRNLSLALTRGYLELSFFYNPESATTILSSPIPAMRTLKDISKIIDNGVQETTDYIKGVDNARDKTPMGYYSIQQLPFIGVLNKSIDPFRTYEHK